MKTTPDQSSTDEWQRSMSALALARARQPGANDRQKPSRRHQMFYAAWQAAKVLEEAAELMPEPSHALDAANALRTAALRLGSGKPRRSRGLPSRGRLTNAGRNVTREQMRASAEAAEAIASGLLDDER